MITIPRHMVNWQRYKSDLIQRRATRKESSVQGSNRLHVLRNKSCTHRRVCWLYVCLQ